MANDTNTPTANEVITAPPAVPKTPLDPPKVYFNIRWHVTPIVIRYEEDAAALDPAEWTTIPASGAAPPEAEWPQPYYDVNVPPLVVDSADDLKTVDTSRFKPFAFTKALLDASQANLAAAEQPAK